MVLSSSSLTHLVSPDPLLLEDEPAQGAQSVVDGDHHHLLGVQELLPSSLSLLVYHHHHHPYHHHHLRPLLVPGSAARSPPAPEYPDHDGQGRGSGQQGAVHIQIQAVLLTWGHVSAYYVSKLSEPSYPGPPPL